MKNINLFIPGFIPSTLLEHQDLSDFDAFTNLQKIFQYLHRVEISHQDPYQRLSQYLGLQLQNIPIAAYMANAYGIADQSLHWAIISPVQMQASLSQGFITGVMEPDTTVPSEVVETVTSLCDDYGFKAFIKSGQHWLIAYSDNTDIQMTPLAEAIDHNFVPLLPKGPSQHHWHLFHNECQMMMQNPHASAVHSFFQSEGINGFWAWGEGQLPSTVSPKVDMMISDEDWVKGFCQYHDIPHLPLAELPGLSLQQYDNILFIDTSIQTQWALDPDKCLNTLQAIDNLLLEPCLSLLQQGCQLQLDLPPLGLIQCQQKWFHRFWQPKEPLTKIIKKYERTLNPQN